MKEEVFNLNLLIKLKRNFTQKLFIYVKYYKKFFKKKILFKIVKQNYLKHVKSYQRLLKKSIENIIKLS